MLSSPQCPAQINTLKRGYPALEVGLNLGWLDAGIHCLRGGRVNLSALRFHGTELRSQGSWLYRRMKKASLFRPGCVTWRQLWRPLPGKASCQSPASLFRATALLAALTLEMKAGVSEQHWCVLIDLKNNHNAPCNISLSSFPRINLKKQQQPTRSLITILQKTQSVSFHG